MQGPHVPTAACLALLYDVNVASELHGTSGKGLEELLAQQWIHICWACQRATGATNNI